MNQLDMPGPSVCETTWTGFGRSLEGSNKGLLPTRTALDLVMQASGSRSWPGPFQRCLSCVLLAFYFPLRRTSGHRLWEL